jgi:nucleotide-binding universal stress UspA family protein
MFKRVLVPLDTSNLAEIALPYAEELAIKLGSEIILLHVRTSADTPDKPEHSAYLSRITGETEQKIKQAAARTPGKKLKIDSAVIGSPDIITHPAEEILDYAERENISLIVIATHGKTGIRRWALGSTANNVARASKCPVLLIRAAAGISGDIHLNNILVPLDGSNHSEAVLTYIENLASRLKARVSLLNVVEPPFHIYPFYEGTGYFSSGGVIRVPYTDEEIKPMREVAEKYVKGINNELKTKEIEAVYEVRKGSPAEEIIKAEEEMRPDMVAMSTHGHSGFGRWDHGSIADKVLHAGKTPLLLVRPRQS